MPVRASIVALPEPGHAVLRVSELDAAPEGLALSIQRQQGPDIHLADDGWRRTEAWLIPAQVGRKGDVLEFHLGPEICDRLAGIATIRLRVKEPDIGVVGTTVVAWPTMLTSGAAGSSGTYDDTVRLQRMQQPSPAAAPEPEPEPLPLPFEPPPPKSPELRAARDLAPVSRRSGIPSWAIVLILLLIVGGAGYGYYYYFELHPQDVVATAPPPAPPATPGEPPRKSVRDTIADYLATKPTPEAVLAKGREALKAGDMPAAFLLFRGAAESGNPAAQLELGTFYDPLTQPARGGFAPEGARAADWYERAALAGVAEAQRKLGLLLAKGGAGLTADPAKARTWLQQAAAQNDTDAKKALDALPK
ncbi:MAG: tetratricopeptide repeat protein [Reyranella sp.]|nr:tetratricopeptide repeat protein [Reyranella sp.]